MRISDWSSDVCSSDLLCPVLCFSFFNAMRFISEHYETPWNEGKLTGTRTVISNPVHSWFWNNINWHIGHHVFPRVHCYNLVELHKLIEPDNDGLGRLVDKGFKIDRGLVRERGGQYV